MRNITYHIDTTITILEHLKSRGYSHSLIVRLKSDNDCVQLNSSHAFVKTMMYPGDTLVIIIKETDAVSTITPVNIPLEIIHEDEDLIIINKAVNMPIHPSVGNHDNTLANAIAWKYKKENKPFVYRCINRLDRDTTGLLILAKHAYSGALLSNMVATRKIHREYLAVVQGNVAPIITKTSNADSKGNTLPICTPSPSDLGTIIAPIHRVNNSVIKREVHTSGEYACTHYKVLSYKNGYSLLSLKLETGRTHQIRVHMEYLGHPLPGDFLYNPDYSVINRQALHSHILRFTHPITNKEMEFISPLPDDMANILN